MAVLKHELRQGRNALVIWTGIIAFMLGVCVLIYPEMKKQMSEISGMFADMGSFSAAFGMDKINFGEFIGYFGVECGNVLGLGGAFFAALLGISALAKEEKEHTAEFLLTHPVSRGKIVVQKLCSVFLQIAVLNVVVIGVAVLSAFFVGRCRRQRFSHFYFLHILSCRLKLRLFVLVFLLSLAEGGWGLAWG